MIQGLDPGVKRLVLALNKLPGVATEESCDGDSGHAFVIFSYDGDFPWVERILSSLNEEFCLGCLGARFRLDYHMDCSNTLFRLWWLEVCPRSSNPQTRKDVLRALDIMAEEVEHIAKELRGNRKAGVVHP